MEVSLQVLVDSSVKGLIPEAISFETGLTREEAANPTLYAYEHHGESFSQADPGALTSMFEDMTLGRPLPLKFACRNIAGADTLVAITLFLHRDLCIHPNMAGFVAQVDLTHRRGVSAYAHIDGDLARFLNKMLAMFVGDLPKHEEGSALRQCIDWIQDYVRNGNLPHLGAGWPEPKVLDVGTNGFVLAECDFDPTIAWISLFQQGYLRGVLFSGNGVLATRKSVYVDFNLSRAHSILSDIEPGWSVDELWLRSPPDGTALTREQIMAILVRV